MSRKKIKTNLSTILEKDKEGKQYTVFDKVNWNSEDLFKIQTGNRKMALSDRGNTLSCSPATKGLEVTKRKGRKQGANYNFNQLNLNDIRIDLDSNAVYRDNCWVANIEEQLATPNSPSHFRKFPVFRDVHVQTGTHLHKAFESITFRDVVVRFKYVDGTTDKTFDLHLDPSSPQYPTSPQYPHGVIPKILYFTGINGVLAHEEEDNDYQVGLVQSRYFDFQCGKQKFVIKIDISVVFKYGYNDFEPGAVIDACKVFPQISFSSYGIAKHHWHTNYTDNLMLDLDEKITLLPVDLMNFIPGAVNEGSLSIDRYFGRVKMVVNLDNSHHVKTKAYNEGGNTNYYDENFLDDIRSQTGGLNKIPPEFERKFIPNFDKNIVGLYSDANVLDGKGGYLETDERLHPEYKAMGAGMPLSPPSPFWADSFDYIKYHFPKAYEFLAVKGKAHADFIQPGYFKEWPKVEYEYPSGSGNKLSLLKHSRQGAYDNIHLTGYLGHYKDNNKLVTHAPICGYCCFHMHFRWSPVAEYAATRTSVAALRTDKGTQKISDKSYKNKYVGWNFIEAHGAYSQGAPLIPYNQQLKIAITHPTNGTTYPDHPTDRVVPQNDNTDLHKDKKAIWYSAEIVNGGLGESHVVLEQGCGYAYEYSDVARALDVIVNDEYEWGSYFSSAFTSLDRYFEEKIMDDIFGYDDITDSNSNYHEFYNKAKNNNRIFPNNPEILDEYNTPLLYEILYRIMRNFNGWDKVPSHAINTYKDYDQVPTNHIAPDKTTTDLYDTKAYPDLSDMEEQDQ